MKQLHQTMCSQQPIIYFSTNATFSTYISEPLLHYLPQHYRTFTLDSISISKSSLIQLSFGHTSYLAYLPSYSRCLYKYLILPLSFTSSLWKQIALSFHHLFFNNFYWNMFEQPSGPLPPQSTLNISDGYTYDSLSSPFHLCFSSHLLFSVYSFYFFFFLLTSMFSEQMVTVKIL